MKHEWTFCRAFGKAQTQTPGSYQCSVYTATLFPSQCFCLGFLCLHKPSSASQTFIAAPLTAPELTWWEGSDSRFLLHFHFYNRFYILDASAGAGAGGRQQGYLHTGSPSREGVTSWPARPPEKCHVSPSLLFRNLVQPNISSAFRWVHYFICFSQNYLYFSPLQLAKFQLKKNLLHRPLLGILILMRDFSTSTKSLFRWLRGHLILIMGMHINK